jgi:hypothetical protein
MTGSQQSLFAIVDVQLVVFSSGLVRLLHRAVLER